MRTNESQLALDVKALDMRIDQLERENVGIRQEVAELRGIVEGLNTPELRAFVLSEQRSRDIGRQMGEAAASGFGVQPTRRSYQAPLQYPEGVVTREQKMEHEGFLIDGSAATRELGKKLQAARLESENAGIE